MCAIFIILRKIFWFWIFISLMGCGDSKGTSTGNPIVSLNLKGSVGAFIGASNDFNNLAVSSMGFCFKRIRFKTSGESTNADTATDEDNIDFKIGYVLFAGNSVQLGNVNLPVGTYSRVEFDLEDDCGINSSAEVVNSSGTFISSQRISIKFEGNFVHTAAGSQLDLALDQILTAADTITSDNQVRDTLEGASGILD